MTKTIAVRFFAQRAKQRTASPSLVAVYDMPEKVWAVCIFFVPLHTRGVCTGTPKLPYLYAVPIYLAARYPAGLTESLMSDNNGRAAAFRSESALRRKSADQCFRREAERYWERKPVCMILYRLADTT